MNLVRHAWKSRSRGDRLLKGRTAAAAGQAEGPWMTAPRLHETSPPPLRETVTVTTNNTRVYWCHRVHEYLEGRLCEPSCPANTFIDRIHKSGMDACDE